MQSWRIIADRLNRDGWNVTSFCYTDRDGQTLWRVGAKKADGPSFTIQAKTVSTAILGLATCCRKAMQARADRTHS
jgi:hypothetical protein